MRRLIPLRLYRYLPTPILRWLFREELARGQELVDRTGWSE